MSALPKKTEETASETSSLVQASKLKMPDLRIPKVSAPDFSKLNFRKFNWLTVFAVLSYLQILALIPFFFGRKSSFVTFHARQGVLLLVIWVLFLFSFYVTFLPWLFALYLSVGIIWGITSVVTGHEWELPWIGKLAK